MALILSASLLRLFLSLFNAHSWIIRLFAVRCSFLFVAEFVRHWNNVQELIAPAVERNWWLSSISQVFFFTSDRQLLKACMVALYFFTTFLFSNAKQLQSNRLLPCKHIFRLFIKLPGAKLQNESFFEFHFSWFALLALASRKREWIRKHSHKL